MTMSEDEPITYWLQQLETGDQDASRRLWQRYYRELVDLARARLATTSRRVSDEEDVALSVMRCLYEGSARGRFTDVVNRQQLWRILATITVRKVIDLQRRIKQQKRGGGQVGGDAALQDTGGDRDLAGLDQLRGDAPSPEAMAIAAEEYQRLMALLGDDRLREVAQWKLEGEMNEQIAERTGLTIRSIERKLQRIRRLWAAELPR
jgi:DNA-directed RNA polymerase specialized sigma24 family protein